jgi:LacI family transcriptional regulator, repressor for deo operon, udp, cdd, tsx, nupC, and nupG
MPGQTPKRLRNMKEFSDATGVSRPTVSKYFHDPGSVRASTRAKIEAALERFDYRPNFLAVNQNRRNPKTVGIIVPQLTDPFYAEIVGRIERACIARGYSAIILSSHGAPQDELRAIDMMRALNIGGLILSPLGAASDLDRVERLADEVPVLLFDSYIGETLPSLTCDNTQGIRLIVDHLCQTGEGPCYIDMPEVNTTAIERREAYLAAMAANGKAPVVYQAGPVRWDFEQIGYEIAQREFAAGGFARPSVVCGNDRFAVGVLKAACDLGIRIGAEGALRVAGHDDHPFSVFACPGLTTVAQDTAGLAERAVEMILEMMRTGTLHSPHVRLPSKLVLRGSA